MVLRAAAAPRVPVRYGDMASTVARYVGEVKKLAADQREQDRALKDLDRDDVFKLTSNPVDPTAAPEEKGVTPLIDMLALEDASDHLTRSSRAVDAAFDRASPDKVAKAMAVLKGVDQLLLDKDGLPGRPWYRNLIYAPGTLTGYGAKTLPGIREGIEQRHFDDAKAYVAKTAAALNRYADRLDAAVKLLKS
ncbi:MAG TPA: transferrin receptor-like dimerization domain-containing protein, partial [Sphingomonas sp.]|nr:transferrin receptor-like dimerization domain-containing protein [Sphingomonas sp.]